MTGMRFVPVLLAACTLALPAFAGSETRSVSGFTRIDLMAPVDLEVRPGKFGVTLQMDPEVAQHLITEVQGDTLRIALDGQEPRLPQEAAHPGDDARDPRGPHPGQRRRGHRRLQGPGEGGAPESPAPGT